MCFIVVSCFYFFLRVIIIIFKVINNDVQLINCQLSKIMLHNKFVIIYICKIILYIYVNVKFIIPIFLNIRNKYTCDTKII